MKLSTKIAYNTIIQIFSKFLSTILGLIAFAIITRYLGREGFGEYTTIITFLSFFGIAADMGLTLVTAQMISQEGVDEDKALRNLFTLRIISALIILGAAPLIVLFFPYSTQIKYCISIGTISFFFIALNQIFVGLFQKKLRMDKVSIAEIVSRIFLVLGIILAYKMNYGLTSIIWVTIISSAISFAIHYYYSFQFTRLKFEFDLNYWKKIIITSWPMAVTITLNLIYLRADTLLLSVIKRPSEIGIIAEVGIYGAAYKIIDVLITIPFMFAGIILPIITNLWSKKDYQKFKEILQRAFEIMVILSVPIVVGTQFIAKDLMIIVAQDEFAASGLILQFLIFASFCIFIANVFSHAIVAINKVKKLIPIYFFTAISALIGYLIIIPRFSYIGAAWVTIYSEAIMMFACIYITYKHTKFVPKLKIVIKSIVSAMIMAGSILLLFHFNLGNIFIIIPVSSVVYFISITLLRGLDYKELLQLVKKQ